MMSARVARMTLALGLLLAVLLGAAVAGGHRALGVLNAPFGLLADLPVVALVVGTAAVGAVPLLVRRWQWATAALLGWLVVEDLVRKLAGNDLAVYFVKDLLLVIVLVAVAVSPRSRRLWRSTTGWTRWALYALGVWALVMAVPSALVDVRIPLVGLRLDFMYVPLVVVGALIAADRACLQRWLLGLASLGAASGVVGLVQTLLGPGFLSPATPVPALHRLVLFRGNEISGVVYRPTGLFVDPSRFASMALVALAISLAALFVTEGWRRWLALVCAAVNGAAVVVSGQRTALLVGVALTALAALAPVLAGRRRLVLRGAVTLLAVVVVGIGVTAVLAPEEVTSRAAWYRTTLDPRLQTSEWALRWNAYSGSAAHGVAVGGVFGQGTGTESLGLQYLFGDPRPELAAYEVEGGYASLAVELGLVGLVLWLAWSGSWVVRQWTGIRRLRGDVTAPVGLVLLGWTGSLLSLQFALSLGWFQNYVSNAYFWLLSGLVLALPGLPDREAAVEPEEI